MHPGHRYGLARTLLGSKADLVGPGLWPAASTAACAVGDVTFLRPPWLPRSLIGDLRPMIGQTDLPEPRPIVGSIQY